MAMSDCHRAIPILTFCHAEARAGRRLGSFDPGCGARPPEGGRRDNHTLTGGLHHARRPTAQIAWFDIRTRPSAAVCARAASAIARKTSARRSAG